MSDLAKMENDLLALSPAERERLALIAWESLGDGSEVSQVESLDPEGLEIARRRDKSLRKKDEEPISHEQFLRAINRSE